MNKLHKFEGDLYDTTVSFEVALRKDYDRTLRHIETGLHLRSTLRGGAYAWPGGYPLYFVTADGEAVSFDGARRTLRSQLEAIRDKASTRIVGCEVNWEDPDLVCAETNEPIESAYAD